MSRISSLFKCFGVFSLVRVCVCVVVLERKERFEMRKQKGEDQKNTNNTPRESGKKKTIKTKNIHGSRSIVRVCCVVVWLDLIRVKWEIAL